MIEKKFIPFSLARNLRSALTSLFPDAPIEFINNEHIFKLFCPITNRVKIGIVSSIAGYYQSVVQIDGQSGTNNHTHTDPWIALKQCVNTGFAFHVETVCNFNSELESFRPE